MVLGVLILNEQLTWYALGGFSLILLGVMVVNGLFANHLPVRRRSPDPEVGEVSESRSSPAAGRFSIRIDVTRLHGEAGRQAGRRFAFAPQEVAPGRLVRRRQPAHKARAAVVRQ